MEAITSVQLNETKPDAHVNDCANDAPFYRRVDVDKLIELLYGEPPDYSIPF